MLGDLPVAEETALDDLHDKICRLSLCHVRAEPVSGEMKGCICGNLLSCGPLLLVRPNVFPDPFQQLLGHLGSSRPSCYSRNPVCSGVPRIHKRFLGSADGQPFPKWHLLQKLDGLASETGQARVQHECN